MSEQIKGLDLKLTYEELEELAADRLDRLIEADTATAKAREELEEANRAREWAEQLYKGLYQGPPAHQPLDSARDKQPNAITTNEQAYRDGTLSQPSAPTADVEKIAREAAHELHLQAYILEPSDNGLINILSKYFAQARAPLVALRMALERAQARIYYLNGQKDDFFTRDIAAALTDTGEKECPK